VPITEPQPLEQVCHAPSDSNRRAIVAQLTAFLGLEHPAEREHGTRLLPAGRKTFLAREPPP
jgi:hypothetical protein